MKTLLTVHCMTAATLIFATPVVSNVTLEKGNDGAYAINYKLSDGPAVVTLGIETNTMFDGSGAWAPMSGSTVWCVEGDVNRYVSATNGTIAWRPTGEAIPIQRVKMRAAVTAWPLDDLPPYMAVDLSEVTTQRIRYFSNRESIPGGELDPVYRTTVLLLKRIHARGATVVLGAGKESGELGAQDDEPLHEASFTHDYYIGVFEFTQGQYWSIVGASPSNYSVGGAMRPADNASYFRIREGSGNASDAEHVWPLAPAPDSVLGKLRTCSKTDQFADAGIDFDLPQEDQWEYACRAGCGVGYWNNGKPILHTGSVVDENFPGRCRYNQSVWDNKTSDTTCGPEKCMAICGSYEPNAWGLYDMHGNLWEYCVELFSSSGTERVRRGGAWNSAYSYCRSACRLGQAPGSPADFIGFRVYCRAGLNGD